MNLYAWMQRHGRVKAAARRALAGVLRALPASAAYRVRRGIETAVYRSVTEVGELPPIFHYWSNTYLRPRLEQAGYASPDDFFFHHIRARALATDRTLHCASIASGRCEMEIAVLLRLRAEGVDNVRIVAHDINPAMLEDARRAADAHGVGDAFTFDVVDLNAFVAAPGSADVVIANQCLHHFTALESILDRILRILTPDGVLLTSDVIGRNGHRLWPEALHVVEQLWQTLPPHWRRDRALGTVATHYVNYDHANVGFEGIRAQDILGLLLERYDFDECIAFACLVLPFVERRFGWNFDPARAEDRDFIDRVAQLDERLIAEGAIKPTQLLAALRPKGDVSRPTANGAARAALRDPDATPPLDLVERTLQVASSGR